MATIRTRQFSLASVAAAGNTTLYTVPAGYRALIKYGALQALATTPGSASLSVVAPAGGACPFLFVLNATRFTLYQSIGIYAVAEAGDIIRANVSSVTGGNLLVTVGGILFEL